MVKYKELYDNLGDEDRSTLHKYAREKSESLRLPLKRAREAAEGKKAVDAEVKDRRAPANQIYVPQFEHTVPALAPARSAIGARAATNHASSSAAIESASSSTGSARARLSAESSEQSASSEAVRAATPTAALRGSPSSASHAPSAGKHAASHASACRACHSPATASPT